ncbi:uncharacterized protein LOC129757740 [Uranotaenia lowii]|uniref:uncharacterized protein LOC129757740 n=1 Tax=Uranotaenia lowii TaxID=190385 RepID=UPI00247B25AB|nr:uncharacterized protein LOC129757740 [Uranotaenia lowii]
MHPVAGNIQTCRKNLLSQNYPFRKDSDEDAHGGSSSADCYCQIPPSEYEENFVFQKFSNKSNLRRDLLREQFRRKATQTVLKQAQQRYETLHRQEVERMPLKKQPDYYLAQIDGNDPKYNLYKTDDMVTFWSNETTSCVSKRRNSNFTKPISEQLDQQFG